MAAAGECYLIKRLTYTSGQGDSLSWSPVPAAEETSQSRRQQTGANFTSSQRSLSLQKQESFTHVHSSPEAPKTLNASVLLCTPENIQKNQQRDLRCIEAHTREHLLSRRVPTAGMQSVITHTFPSSDANENLHLHFNKTSPFINKHSLNLLLLLPAPNPP